MTWVLAVVCGLATIPASLRWLRIAQREHYLAPSVTRFALRWWAVGPMNRFLLMLGVAGVVGTLWSVWLGFVVAAVQVGPVGLTLRGTSSPLAWTQRLGRVAVMTGAMAASIYVVGGLSRSPFIVVTALFALPLIVDLALVLLAPVERALGSKWVDRATDKLNAIAPDVVAITGSYGKTTTKNYVAHLLTGFRRTVTSPASFNNRMGLARAINENLAVGTEIFVAEMGTYGSGEIAELCEWIPPTVAAVVAVGPVHLERFRSEDRIVAAKSEILDRAEIGVICVDHPLLAKTALERTDTMEIIEVSTGETGRIRVFDSIIIDGAMVAVTPPGVFRPNLAVAIGICLALGMSAAEIVGRLSDVPVAEHRQSVTKSDLGFSIVDDTFNSNPDGANRALHLLAEAGRAGKTAVVTPGMVELGPVQAEENVRFASDAAVVADHLLIVGSTNKKSLIDGAAGGDATVIVVDSRDEAVEWIRRTLGPDDAVLYENDLPDHYP
jgi:UDP-N-acetylmuramoyl-tripeptide--D-alanyl-D-alanine ligase